MKKLWWLNLVLLCWQMSALAEVQVGSPAPSFSTLTHEGKKFDLEQQKGRWTILYFYPKADTPGCTKEACSFRDGLKKLAKLNADVYGVSSDGVAALKGFHEKHQLNFVLLSDEKLNIIENFGAKMPVLKMAKRWTFILGPDLTVKYIDKEVDPVFSSDAMAKKIQQLQATSKN